MRPGPGLVVMALAFISGARRGTTKEISPSQGGKLGHNSGNDDTGALVRLNPWLSACDLAQPNSAPDLQGQCSASTLPVAWVDEGPGPPRCPESCERIKSEQHNNNINKNNYNTNLNNLKNTNNILQSINNNLISKNTNNIKMEEENRLNSDEYIMKKQQQQQCLDYLGDNEESSPAQICNKTMRDIKFKLKHLRLRHCCERSALSALKNDALNIVLNGGSECIRTLRDLAETDALAARITCEFTEILVRYDCRQPYSLIHHCEDCKEAYRRWVCSTLIPYFAEPDDIRPTNHSILNSLSRNLNSTNTNNTKSNNNINLINNKTSNNSKNKINIKDNPSSSLQVSGEDPLLSRVLRRSRRKSRTETIRHRIKPCLNVCQTVEQKCPYFLPADRAPAFPTQYAGEPTFLCSDPNIDETGEQLEKSNTGPENCCYDYCGSPYAGLCPICDTDFNQTNNNSILISNDNSQILQPNQNVIDSGDEHQQHTIQCQIIPTNTTPSQNPCIIPYYASSSSSTSLPSSPPIITFNIKINNYKITFLNYHKNNKWMMILWSLIFNVAAWTKILHHQLAGS